MHSTTLQPRFHHQHIGPFDAPTAAWPAVGVMSDTASVPDAWPERQVLPAHLRSDVLGRAWTHVCEQIVWLALGAVVPVPFLPGCQRGMLTSQHHGTDMLARTSRRSHPDAMRPLSR